MIPPRVRPTLLLVLLPVAAGTLAYVNSLTAPFLFDDTVAITNNPDIQHIGPIRFAARWLVDLSFRLNYAIGGFNVADYHAVNVAIHLAAGLCLFGLLRRTLQSPRLASRYGGDAGWLASLASALWVVHPLQTQSVTYVCQRYEALMGLCFLGAVYAFARGLDAPRPRPWFDLALLACVLGMGTKEIMVMAPPLMLLYDTVFGAGSLRAALRRRWRVHVALWATLGILAMMEVGMMAGALRQRIPTAGDVPPLRYLAAQFGVILHYLRLSVWPTGLCLDYAWSLPRTAAAVLLPGAVVSAAVAATVAGVWRNRPAAYAGAWFFLILAPSSSIFPVRDLIFEHRMYLPLAAVTTLAALAVHAAARGLGPRRGRIAAAAALAAVLVVLTGLTVARNRDYRSTEAMWRDVMRKQPDNYRQQVSLTSALMERLDPDSLKEAEAIARALVERTARKRREQGADPVLPANDAGYYHDIALEQRGRALLGLGRVDEALQCFDLALRGLPGSKTLYHNRAVGLMLTGRLDDARRAAEDALAIEPGYTTGRGFLAFVLAEQRQYAGAVREYRRALRDDPAALGMRLELAWLLATASDAGARNGAEAVALAEGVCRDLQWKSVRALDVLAAAYAEAGRMPEAIAALRRGLACAAAGAGATVPAAVALPPGVRTPWSPRPRGSMDPDDLRARLQLYEQGQPYHEA